MLEEELQEAVSTAGPRELNAVGRGGQTPLMFAVLSGSTRAVVALLQAGADPSIPETVSWASFGNRVLVVLGLTCLLMRKKNDAIPCSILYNITVCYMRTDNFNIWGIERVFIICSIDFVN